MKDLYEGVIVFMAQVEICLGKSQGRLTMEEQLALETLDCFTKYYLQANDITREYDDKAKKIKERIAIAKRSLET